MRTAAAATTVADDWKVTLDYTHATREATGDETALRALFEEERDGLTRGRAARQGDLRGRAPRRALTRQITERFQSAGATLFTACRADVMTRLFGMVSGTGSDGASRARQ
ncbi:hypothetical protein HPO96_34680 [Kribbella sandramycini]|uniref:Uncharacterized protein n=1 Tax=Kribbella sandramycini TaxID=60450 RepID=A0A7Y4P2J0_9ACTN|nr:hypothetical protein [Kribbella sandramycini]MBB6570091.1 hypothetical protein [Kribbella sandramycini]NOL45407.1 hypothetical protein [Kribbella sandramycini]